jgi:hypothetical protein
MGYAESEKGGLNIQLRHHFLYLAELSHGLGSLVSLSHIISLDWILLARNGTQDAGTQNNTSSKSSDLYSCVHCAVSRLLEAIAQWRRSICQKSRDFACIVPEIRLTGHVKIREIKRPSVCMCVRARMFLLLIYRVIVNKFAFSSRVVLFGWIIWLRGESHSYTTQYNSK